MTIIVNDHSKLWSLANDCGIDIKYWFEIDENSYLVNYQPKLEDEDHPGSTSYAVSSYVTSWARLKLYDLIEQIECEREGRVLYVDTDSVIFIERESDPVIATGDFLGELTDELTEKCTAGLFMGAKSYILRIGEGEKMKDLIKCKGVMMTPTARRSLSLDAVANLIREQSGVINVPQTTFRAQRETQLISTVKFDKLFRVTSDKRVVHADGTSVPYGFIKHSLPPCRS